MISVITPVYQGERFIESCIKVVMDQNCSDVEHIIVDGGSKDRTVDIAKKYAEKYPYIRWVSEEDKGQSDAMNKGIEMAKGEILAILNVDDYYEPDVLNRILNIFETLPEPSLLVGNCNVRDDENKIKFVNIPRKLKALDLLSFSSPFPLNPSAYFYHKSLHQKIGLYKVDEHYMMDIDFILKAVQVAVVKHVDEVLGNHRQIVGTKTMNLLESGQHSFHLSRLLKEYQKTLSPVQTCKLFLKSKFNRITYYLDNPKALLVTIRTKLNNLIQLNRD